MKLGSTQRIVLENVAARRAPFAGHKSHAEYTRRMDVARQLEKRGLLVILPVGHPEIRGTRPEEVMGSIYRLTEAGRAALVGEPTAIPASRTIAHSARKSPRQLDHEIASALTSASTADGDMGIFYLTDTKERPLGPGLSTLNAAKRAAMKLVRNGTYPRVEVWHRWRGGRYMQGQANDEGWSDV